MSNGRELYGESLHEIVARHDRDLYRGNGLPGITTRMAAVESRVSTIEQLLKEKANKSERKLNILLATTLTLLGTIVLKFIFHIN